MLEALKVRLRRARTQAMSAPEVRALERSDHPQVRKVGAALRCALLDRTKRDDGWFSRIEGVRAAYLADSTTVTYADFSKTNDPYTTAPGTTVTRDVSEICSTAAMAADHAPTLYFLIREFGSVNGLELGTNLGVGACYQAAALQANGGRLTTLEGAPPLVERAAASLRELGLTNCSIVCGVFAKTLPEVLQTIRPIDYAFIDGHHQEEPTVQYFSALRPKLADGAIVVFDDITWSDGMQRAWQRIKQSPGLSATIQMRRFGIVIIGAGAVRDLYCSNC